jgi:hypothetical protein
MSIESARMIKFIWRKITAFDPRILDEFFACYTSALADFKKLVNDLSCVFGDVFGH